MTKPIPAIAPRDISIGVARSSEPDDAYFWRCICGKSAIASGRSHFVAMTKPRRPRDPTRYAAPGTPPPSPEKIEQMYADFVRDVGPLGMAHIEKLRGARERRRTNRNRP